MAEEKTLQLILDKLDNLENGQQQLKKNQQELIKNQQQLKDDVRVIRETVAKNKVFLENHTHQTQKGKLAK